VLLICEAKAIVSLKNTRGHDAGIYVYIRDCGACTTIAEACTPMLNYKVVAGGNINIENP